MIVSRRTNLSTRDRLATRLKSTSNKMCAILTKCLVWLLTSWQVGNWYRACLVFTVHLTSDRLAVFISNAFPLQQQSIKYKTLPKIHVRWCNWTKCMKSTSNRRRRRHGAQSAAGRWFIDLTSTWGFIHWRRRRFRGLFTLQCGSTDPSGVARNLRKGVRNVFRFDSWRRFFT